MQTLAKLFLRWLEKRGSYRLIMRDGEPYLGRYILLRIGTRNRLYLHRFWASDLDDPHDHPWWNASLLLKGGYREHFHDGTYKERKVGNLTIRDAKSLHRIEIHKGKEGESWSLFFTGKRIRQWGFMTKDGWVSARDYMGQTVEVRGRNFDYKGWLFPKIVWKK